jgi:site-specific DNA-methyltransferase (adenine-specific)
VLRVLKPGGYLLAFGGSRTAHRIACAIEDAGFEIRDSLEWLYGSGFPKSMNVSKAIDKAAGAERAVVGVRAKNYPDTPSGYGSVSAKGGTRAGGIFSATTGDVAAGREVTVAATAAAKQWNGWGTALKPSHEPIIVARKPFPGTVASQVLATGTGAINIDACRVAHASADDLAGHEAQVAAIKARGGKMADSWKNSSDLAGANDVNTAGRWPPNTLLTHSAACRVVGARPVKANPTWATPNRECESGFTGEEVSEVRHTNETVLEYDCAADCPVREMDGQSGTSHAGVGVGGIWTRSSGKPAGDQHGDSGTASRFFPQSQWIAVASAGPAQASLFSKVGT